MLARTLLLACLITTPAFAQNGIRALFGPPKPRVVATPTPAPAATPTPAPKRRAKPHPVEAAATSAADGTAAAPAVPAPVPTPTPKPEPRNDRLTAYVVKVKAAFAKRWAAAVTPALGDFSPGNCHVTFKLDAEGKVAAFAAGENTSNEAFGKFCEQFVRETEFEKPPAKLLTEGQVEIPFTFSIY